MVNTIVDPELAHLSELACRDGLRRIGNILDHVGPLPGYPFWFSVSYDDFGMPVFSPADETEAPPDFKSLFHGPSARISLWNFDSFQDFFDYIDGRNEIRDYFGVTEGLRCTVSLKSLSLNYLTQIIDRCIHIGATDDNFRLLIEGFHEVYKPLEAGLLTKRLEASLIVPISNLTFEFDHFTLLTLPGGNSALEIIRLDDDLQKTRRILAARETSSNLAALENASHAVVFTGWPINNRNYWSVKKFFANSSSQPLCFIEAFFSALKLLGGDSDFHQVLFKPKGWTLEYYADLPPLEGCLTYKAKLDQHVPDSRPIVFDSAKAGELAVLLQEKMQKIRNYCEKGPDCQEASSTLNSILRGK